MPVQIQLRPYERQLVSISFARWFHNRASFQPPHKQGNIRICRGPSEFEPNPTWSLNDMLLYANMVDEGFFTKEKIAHEFGDEKQWEGKPDELHNHIVKLWQFLFHRLVDDEYALPSQAAFEKRKADMVNRTAAATRK